MNTNLIANRVIALVILTTLSATQIACSGTSTPESASGSTPTEVASSGEALFRGIILGQGDVAAKLPEIWASSARRDTRELAARSKTTTELATELDRAAGAFEEEGLSASATVRLRDKAANLRAQPVTTVTMSPESAPDSAMVDTLVAAVRAHSPDFFDSFGADIQSGDPVRVDAAIAHAGEQAIIATSSAGMPSLMRGDPGADCVYLPVAVFIAAAGIFAVNIAIALDAVLWEEDMYPRHPESISRTHMVELITSRFAQG